MKLGTPHGMIDLDPEDSRVHLKSAGVIRDLRADGFRPSLDRHRFFKPSAEGRVLRADLREDVLDGVEGHRVRTNYMIRPSLSIRRALFSFGALLPFAPLLFGCGYGFQNSKTNSLREVGVNRIYVQPVKNGTYKPGVENLFYNELTQALLAGHRVKLVDRPEFADAILETQVTTANYAPSATTSAGSIYPTTVSAITITVATEYQATVNCGFQLRRQKDGAAGEVLWGSDFSRSKRFAGNNQKIEYGTTSGLINESEFDRTLKEIAHGMMQDVHEAMVARF